MNAPAAIRACFAEWRMVKSRSVLQLILEVPIEETETVLNALGAPLPSKETWVGVALLKGGDAPSTPPDPPCNVAPVAGSGGGRRLAAKERYQTMDEGERAVTRAAMLAHDSAFGRWCNCETADDAADYIRRVCRVDSRREIASNLEALERFKMLEYEYQIATGRAASPTGA